MNLNFTEIKSFPLAWRWVSKDHGNFSSEELEKIQPLSEESAKLLRTKSINCTFEKQKSFDASKPLNEVAKWLEEVIPPNEIEIFVSWGPTEAILTTREFFIPRWDDFCYPSSDDVEIYSSSYNFQLNYHHYKVFEFCEKKAC